MLINKRCSPSPKSFMFYKTKIVHKIIQMIMTHKIDLIYRYKFYDLCTHIWKSENLNFKKNAEKLKSVIKVLLTSECANWTSNFEWTLFEGFESLTLNPNNPTSMKSQYFFYLQQTKMKVMIYCKVNRLILKANIIN